jgi:DNA-binding LytR/AlgR family response regulator
MTYTAIIADDEKELRVYLRTLLNEAWPELTICGEAAHGQEALELVESLNPQIAFLDIKMPGMSGLQVAKKIAGLCHIVFVTAYDQYAVEAFERDAVDYLVKPVTKKRLRETVARLKKQLQTSNAPPENIAALITQVMSSIQNQS